MKILKWIVAIVIVLILSVYVLAFTGIGNSIVAPIVEGKINEATGLDSKLEIFKLDMSSIDILLQLDSDNSIAIKGSYSLFSQSFDLNYNVMLNKLVSLEKLVQMKLNGAFLTDGKVVGDMQLFNIDGKSDVAASATSYHVELQELNPTSIIAKIDDADLASLLYILNQKKYADAKLNLDVNLKNIKPHQLEGDLKLVTTDGKLNVAVMKKDFNITIPKTDFKMKLDAKLKGDDVIYSYLLNSNLAKIGSSGTVVPDPLQVNSTYALNVQELAVLKPITNADIRGVLNLSGNVKGSQEKMVVDGISDIAASKTTFEAILKEFKPSSLQAKIEHLQLQKLLYMIKQPHYADAVLNMDVKLSSLDMNNLKGDVKTAIKDGVLDSKYLTKTYEFKSPMPKTTFNMTEVTKLAGTLADTQVDFNSNLADLDIKSAKFDLKDSSIVSDYKVKVHDLNRLYFATQRKLKGSIVATGELKKAKDLDLTMLSSIAGGKLDAKLHNDDLKANISNMQTLDVLDILIYPKIFKSKVDGVLKYNLAQAKGTFDAKLKDGEFTKNQVLDLTKKYAKVDMYKQIFVGDANAKIDKENIVALLDLKSNTSAIYTKDTKLNSKTQRIDSNIKIIGNNNPPLYVQLQGDVNSPKVTVDASAILKDEAKKAVDKQVNKLFKKLF
ncbi:hypothetical protein [Sulfurimonas sp.]|uniref:hypothetical protein n=1 Tax=Sulfurimonas sp. TaxID=2022749 RepID=UPI003D0C4B25